MRLLICLIVIVTVSVVSGIPKDALSAYRLGKDSTDRWRLYNFFQCVRWCEAGWPHCITLYGVEPASPEATAQTYTNK